MAQAFGGELGDGRIGDDLTRAVRLPVMTVRSGSAHGPNFFIIGAEKAGTTSLCELLAAHPSVFISEPKEPNFFTRADVTADELADYTALFAEGSGAAAVGEASTTYSKALTYPGTAERIAAFAPAARILYIARHPLRRLESQWLQRRHVGLDVGLTFDAALRSVPAYIDASLYWRNISAYRNHFPDDRILVLFLEDLAVDREAERDRCLRFLDLPATGRLTDLDQPRNPWTGLREDGRLLGVLRRSRWYHPVRDHVVPPAVRRRLKPMATRPFVQRPEWSADLQVWVRAQTREDNERFLDFYRRPLDFWSMDA